MPRSFSGWLDAPRVVTRPYHKHGRGRGRKAPRLVSGSRSAGRVDTMLDDPRSRGQPWKRYRVKDGHKGPMIWEVKCLRFHPVDADGLPGEPLHLVVARDALNPSEMKFFVSNAPEGTSAQPMLLAAFSRWRVERCFEDQKSEIGLDQYEGRRYVGLRRHLILSGLSYLFLSRVRQELGGGDPELTECQVRTAVSALIPFWWLGLSPPKVLLERTSAELLRTQSRNALARRCHAKRTRRRLRDAGIKLTEVARCRWGST